MNIRKSFVNPFSCAPFFDAKYFFLWMVLSEWLFSLILSPFLPSLFQFFFLSQSTDPIQNIDTKRISIHNRCNERRKKKLEQKGFCTFFFLPRSIQVQNHSSPLCHNIVASMHIFALCYINFERTCIAINLRWYTNAHFFSSSFVSDDDFFSLYPLFCET